MYVFGEDIAQTDPDTAHVDKALRSLEFMVCQESSRTRPPTTPTWSCRPPRSSRSADVRQRRAALPARRGVDRPARRRPHRLRHHHDRQSDARTRDGLGDPVDALDEISRLTPHYRGVSYETIGRRACSGRCIPTAAIPRSCMTEYFDRPGGKGAFAALPYKAPGDAADREFPLVLVTGRLLQHYNAGTMTRGPATPSWSTATGWRSTPTMPSGCGSPTATRSRSAVGSGVPSWRHGSPIESSRATCSPRSTSPRRARTC